MPTGPLAFPGGRPFFSMPVGAFPLRPPPWLPRASAWAALQVPLELLAGSPPRVVRLYQICAQCLCPGASHPRCLCPVASPPRSPPIRGACAQWPPFRGRLLPEVALAARCACVGERFGRPPHASCLVVEAFAPPCAVPPASGPPASRLGDVGLFTPEFPRAQRATFLPSSPPPLPGGRGHCACCWHQTELGSLEWILLFGGSQKECASCVLR